MKPQSRASVSIPSTFSSFLRCHRRASEHLIGAFDGETAHFVIGLCGGPPSFGRRAAPSTEKRPSSSSACVVVLLPSEREKEGEREIHHPASPIAMEVMHHSTAFLLPPAVSPAPEIKQRHPPTFYALVVLNQPLPSFTPLLWQHAQLKVFADGGANRVFDEMPLLFPQEDVLSIRRRYKPDAIKGDMDSIRPEVLDFYAALGSETIDESQDQDTTDLHKCVSYIRDYAEKLKQSNLCIIVTGALGGRFDHEAGNLNVLYRFSTLRIILVSRDCLIHLLPKTHRHEIHIEPTVVGPHCGLVPVGVPSSRSTTTGLKWNLSDTEMKFGGLVSTSNLVKDKTVIVQSDSDLLWTVCIKSTEKDSTIQ